MTKFRIQYAIDRIHIRPFSKNLIRIRLKKNPDMYPDSDPPINKKSKYRLVIHRGGQGLDDQRSTWVSDL